LIVLKFIIDRLDVASLETGQVVTAIKRGEAHEINNVLLLKSEEDIEGKEETLLFLLCFLLVTRVKVTSVSGTSTAISISR